MSERGRGRVVNVASDAARVGSSGEAVYALCKGGLIAFSKTIARELARKLLYTKADGIATITINRPKQFNAFTANTCEELIHAFKNADFDKTIGVIVLTGAGDKAFCTGGDQGTQDGGYGGRGVIGLPIEEVQSAIRDCSKPVIARVNGYAIGGGNVLVTI